MIRKLDPGLYLQMLRTSGIIFMLLLFIINYITSMEGTLVLINLIIFNPILLL